MQTQRPEGIPEPMISERMSNIGIGPIGHAGGGELLNIPIVCLLVHVCVGQKTMNLESAPNVDTISVCEGPGRTGVRVGDCSRHAGAREHVSWGPVRWALVGIYQGEKSSLGLGADGKQGVEARGGGCPP